MKKVSVFLEISFTEMDGKAVMSLETRMNMPGEVHYYQIGETIKYAHSEAGTVVSEILEGYTDAIKKGLDVKGCYTVLGITRKLKKPKMWFAKAKATYESLEDGIEKDVLGQVIQEVESAMEKAETKLQKIEAKAKAEAEAKAKAEAEAKVEAQNEVTPVEEGSSVEETNDIPVGETEAEEVLGSKLLCKIKGEYCLKISDTKVISLASISQKDGKAILGEPALSRMSPNDFRDILSNISAEIPTKDELTKLEEFLQELVALVSELFGKEFAVEEFGTLKNQLMMADGKYYTFKEGKFLLPDFKLAYLVSHKVREL